MREKDILLFEVLQYELVYCNLLTWNLVIYECASKVLTSFDLPYSATENEEQLIKYLIHDSTNRVLVEVSRVGTFAISFL